MGLLKVAMKERQLLRTMRGIVEGVNIKCQVSRRRGERGDELIKEHVLRAEEGLGGKAFSNRESVG